MADILTLVDEDFTSGSASGVVWTSSASGASNGQEWTFSSPPGDCVPSSTEMWMGTGGASARGLATTYDHDNNAGTANIDVPGGVEVMSTFDQVGPNDPDGGTPDSMQVAVQVQLPALLDASQAGSVYFWTANRISSGYGGERLRFELYNLTDDYAIIPESTVGQTQSWTYNAFTPSFQASDAGDTVELRFSDSMTINTATGARGMELVDVNFSVTAIPEPASIGLLGVFGLAYALRRRFIN